MTYADAIDRSQTSTAQMLKLIYLILAEGDQGLPRFIADAQADGQAVINDPSDIEELVQLALDTWNSSDDHPPSCGDLGVTGDLVPFIAQLTHEGAWGDMEPGWSHR